MDDTKKIIVKTLFKQYDSILYFILFSSINLAGSFQSYSYFILGCFVEMGIIYVFIPAVKKFFVRDLLTEVRTLYDSERYLEALNLSDIAIKYRGDSLYYKDALEIKNKILFKLNSDKFLENTDLLISMCDDNSLFDNFEEELFLLSEKGFFLIEKGKYQDAIKIFDKITQKLESAEGSEGYYVFFRFDNEDAESVHFFFHDELKKLEQDEEAFTKVRDRAMSGKQLAQSHL